MSETYETADPFTGHTATISHKLIDRLRGKYAVGPTMKNGEPEFGYRHHEIVPIQAEAADEIARLRAENERLEARIGSMCGYPLCGCDQKNEDPSFCLVTNGDVPDPITRETLVADARRSALVEAEAMVAKRRTTYQEECGSYDPETGQEDYPGNGDEWVEEWCNIEDAIATRRDAVKREISAKLASVKAAIDRQGAPTGAPKQSRPAPK